jgi:hypothetical protein
MAQHPQPLLPEHSHSQPPALHFDIVQLPFLATRVFNNLLSHESCPGRCTFSERAAGRHQTKSFRSPPLGMATVSATGTSAIAH